MALSRELKIYTYIYIYIGRTSFAGFHPLPESELHLSLRPETALKLGLRPEPVTNLHFFHANQPRGSTPWAPQTGPFIFVLLIIEP